MSISMMYLFLILMCIHHAVLASPGAAEVRGGCYYNDRQYAEGETVWKDPECECTRLICKNYKVELVEKSKPCCKYDGNIFGNGETMCSSKCQDTICKEGKPVSLPRCPCNFMPISYSGCVGCYNVSSYQMTYKEAYYYCDGLGARLAEVTSKEEDKALEWWLAEKFYKKGMKYFWIGGYAEKQYAEPNPDMPQMPPKCYLTPFFWKYLKYNHEVKTPVESIYDDWCPTQPSQDPEKNALQLGYYDNGRYCWCNQKPDKLNYAICETCSEEKQYQNFCVYNKKIYAHMDLIKMETDNPGPCYKKYCYYGRYVKKVIPCKEKLAGSPPVPQ